MPELAPVGEISGLRAAQVRWGRQGADSVRFHGGIDHRCYGFASCLPSPTDVSNLSVSLLGAM